MIKLEGVYRSNAMKHLIALSLTIFGSSSSFAAVPCTNLAIKAELVKKFTELQVTPDLPPCELSKKSVEFNFFAIALISESCPSTPEVSEVLARYQAVKDHAEELMTQYCGH